MSRDRERIVELHQRDIRASTERDYATLRTLMSDDAVVLPPGGRMIRGRESIDRSFVAMAGAPVTSDVLEYAFDWHEVEICGEYAFEWGYIRGRERDRATGRETAEFHHVMRILKRQPDGAWKVHRTIWNTAASPNP